MVANYLKKLILIRFGCRLSLVFGSGSSWASSSDCIGPATQDLLFGVNEISRVVQLCTIVDDKYVENRELFKAQLSVTGPNLSVTSSVKYYYINSDDGKYSFIYIQNEHCDDMRMREFE